MYASIRKAQVIPGVKEQFVQQVREGFLPMMRELPGFLTYYLVDTGPESYASVTLFADKAGAEEAGKRAAEWSQTNMAPLMAAPLDVLVGEVVVKEGK